MIILITFRLLAPPHSRGDEHAPRTAACEHGTLCGRFFQSVVEEEWGGEGVAELVNSIFFLVFIYISDGGIRHGELYLEVWWSFFCMLIDDVDDRLGVIVP